MAAKYTVHVIVRMFSLLLSFHRILFIDTVALSRQDFWLLFIRLDHFIGGSVLYLDI